MDLSTVSFQARATGSDLSLLVRFDGQQIFSIDDLPQDFVDITHGFDDSQEQEHVIEIEMLGKIQDHTQVDDQGMILQDRVIEIQKMCLDDIELGYLLTQVAGYHHDGNGTGEPRVEKFFGTMGCNGRVEFRFTSPLYLWLLEHM